MATKKHDSKKKKVLRNSICYVLSFILSLLLFIATITSTLKLSILSPRVLNRAVTSDAYIEGVYDTILDHLKTLSIPNGIEESTYQKIITKDIVATDVKAYFNSQLIKNTGYDFSVSTFNIEKALTNNIIEQFEKENITVTDAIKLDIYEFVETAINQYTSSIKIDYIDYYNQVTDTYKLALIITLAATFVIAAVLILFIFQLNKYCHKSFRFLFFSCASATLMTAVLSIYISLSKIFKKISITPKYFYNAVVHVLNNYLVLLWVSITILALLSALMIYLIKVTKIKQMKKLEEYLSSPRHRRKHRHHHSSKNSKSNDSKPPLELPDA